MGNKGLRTTTAHEQGAGLEAEQLRLELASWSEMLVAEEAECTVLGHCDLALLHD